jgi:hypothetical protein
MESPVALGIDLLNLINGVGASEQSSNIVVDLQYLQQPVSNQRS